MSKKQKALEGQNQEETTAVVAEQTPVEEKKDKKSEKATEVKSKEKDKKKNKKKEKKGSLGKKTRETMSELKKVTWPTFGEVVKKTGIVIAFVVLFGLFFYGVNALLGWLVTLLV